MIHMIKAIIVLLILGMATSCSKPVKVAKPATVESRSVGGQRAPSKQRDDATKAYGVEQEQAAAFSALDDPKSVLAERIIYFDYDSSDVRADYRALVEAHANYLVTHPEAKVILEGHADERGAREYNLALGERRSLSIKRQFVLLGVGVTQIQTLSYGEERPLDQGHDDTSWQRNRRVEIVYQR